jgi:hypothetical protein
METPQEEIARLKAENVGLKDERTRTAPNSQARIAIDDRITANTQDITALRSQLGMFSPPFPVVYPYSLR